MDLNQALQNLKFDTRMKEWNLKQSIVTKDEVEKNLNSLQDRANDAEPVTLEDKEDFGD